MHRQRQQHLRWQLDRPAWQQEFPASSLLSCRRASQGSRQLMAVSDAVSCSSTLAASLLLPAHVPSRRSCRGAACGRQQQGQTQLLHAKQHAAAGRSWMHRLCRRDAWGCQLCTHPLHQPICAPLCPQLPLGPGQEVEQLLLGACPVLALPAHACLPPCCPVLTYIERASVCKLKEAVPTAVSAGSGAEALGRGLAGGGAAAGNLGSMWRHGLEAPPKLSSCCAMPASVGWALHYSK